MTMPEPIDHADHPDQSDHPADEFDRRRRRVLWKMPSGLYLVGSSDGSRRNMMTLNWATQVSLHPKLLAISVQADALTHQLIQAGRVFSLCILDRSDRSVVRKFTKPVIVELASPPESASPPERGGTGPQPPYTMAGFACRDGATGAPVLDQALAYLECRVTQEVGAGSHTLFVGEVVVAEFKNAAAEESEVLRMEDTRMNYGG